MAIQSVGTNLCCCNIDGMDQSKFKIPRVATRISGSTSKLFQRLFRPTLHVSGARCHGHMLNFWVDEDLRKDSSTQQEILSRTLSDISNKHGCLPMGLICQQDNTCREGKNFFCGPHGVACSTSLLLLLRAQLPQSWTQFLGDNVKLCRVWTNVQVFETCFFQDVSASNQGHEDLDQAFSQQAALICRHVWNHGPKWPGEQVRKNRWSRWMERVGSGCGAAPQRVTRFFLISWKSFCLPLNFQMHVILYYHNLALIAASSSSLRTGWVHSHLSTLWCC